MSNIPTEPLSKEIKNFEGLPCMLMKCLTPAVPTLITFLGSFWATFQIFKAPSFFDEVIKSPDLSFIHTNELIP